MEFHLVLICAHRKLVGESDELRDLQELDRQLCVWREKVESTIDSRQPDRIAVRTIKSHTWPFSIATCGRHSGASSQ